MMLKNKFENINTVWARYSGYKLETINGTDFVKATKSSTIQIYNPDEVATEFLIDAINTGKENYYNPDSYKEKTLEFIKKYGTLGWMTYLPIDPYFYEFDNTYLGKHGAMMNDNLSLPTNEYLSNFIDNPEDFIYNSLVVSLGKEKIFDMVFSKEYKEPLIWTASKLQILFTHFFSALNYNNEKMSRDEKVVMQHEVTLYENYGIRFHMVNNPTPKIQWEVNSLLTMLELIHATALSDEDKPLKACKHCGKAYYNKHIKSEFCSVKCRNHYNVLAFRERQKE